MFKNEDSNNAKEDDSDCIIIVDSQESQQNDQIKPLKKHKKKHKYHKRLHIRLPLPKKRKISENINNIEPLKILKIDTEEDVVRTNDKLLDINEKKKVINISENLTDKKCKQTDLKTTTSIDDANIKKILTDKKDIPDGHVEEKQLNDIEDKDIKLIDWKDDNDDDEEEKDSANNDQKPKEINKQESRLDDLKELVSEIEVSTILKDNAVKQSEITSNDTKIEIDTLSTDENDSENESDNKFTKEIKSVQIDGSSTPKQIRPDPSLLFFSDSNRKLTPKQLKHREEMDKRQREKQLAKEERDRKIQEEKELRQRERDDKERQRKQEKEQKEELKKREREEKDEQRRKEKEEREQKRQAEIEAKNEERRKKEEQRDEERRKRDEEKKQKEEAELKAKKKASQAFTKFFVPTSKLQSPTILLSTSTTTTTTATIAANNDDEINAAIENLQNIKFMPFCIKGDMKLAPIKRRNLTDIERTSFEIKCLSSDGGGREEADDNSGDKNNNMQLYLELMKNKKHMPIKTKNNKSNDDNIDGDCCLIIGNFLSE